MCSVKAALALNSRRRFPPSPSSCVPRGRAFDQLSFHLAEDDISGGCDDDAEQLTELGAQPESESARAEDEGMSRKSCREQQAYSRLDLAEMSLGEARQVSAVNSAASSTTSSRASEPKTSRRRSTSTRTSSCVCYSVRLAGGDDGAVVMLFPWASALLPRAGSSSGGERLSGRADENSSRGGCVPHLLFAG